MTGLFSFDRFVTPTIIRIAYSIGLIVIVVGTLLSIISGMREVGALLGIIVPLILMCVLGLIWRIWCEMVLVFFDMRDHLANIEARVGPPAAPYQPQPPAPPI